MPYPRMHLLVHKLGIQCATADIAAGVFVQTPLDETNPISFV